MKQISCDKLFDDCFQEDIDNTQKNNHSDITEIELMMATCVNLSYERPELLELNEVHENLVKLTEKNTLKNYIEILPLGIFEGLHNLRSIYLSSNKLETLPKGIFGDLNSLGAIDLSSNNIQTLPNGIFEGLYNLKSKFTKYF